MYHSKSRRSQLICLLLTIVSFAPTALRAEDVGERWGTEEREREYYPIVNIPLPEDTVIEAGAFAVLPDQRVAVGTRHGEIFLIDGVDARKPNPSFHRFATGLDEIFGLTWKDNAFRVTQSCELTRVSDVSGDGVADRFETISDAWGYANYHEYAFGSKLDADGNQFVALGLSASYYSHALNRGFIMKIAPDGKATAFASGLRSPGGIGFDEHDSLFYIESQGPWNCSCSLKAVSPYSFHGHPASFQLVSVFARDGARAGNATLRQSHRHREASCQATGALRRDLPLYPHGAVNHSVQCRSDWGQIRSV